jgi:hypothetical protein
MRENSKFEIRNSKYWMRGARIIRILLQGVSLTPFEFLISNFEFSSPLP